MPFRYKPNGRGGNRSEAIMRSWIIAGTMVAGLMGGGLLASGLMSPAMAEPAGKPLLSGMKNENEPVLQRAVAGPTP